MYSNLEKISIEVSQGSILDPLLYIIYVNNFQHAVDSTPRLYADDTCLLVESKNLETLQIFLNNEMIKVSNWMTINQLTINTNKPSFMIILPHYQNKPVQLQINIDGQYQNSQDNVKYLGIQLDQHLNFKYYN